MRINQPAMLLLLLLTALSARAQDKCELYSDTLVANLGDQYHLFIKSYSKPVNDYLKDHARITIDFETENPDIITVGGAWFKPTKAGEAKMKAVIYQESKIKDYPDWNNKLDSVSFLVQVPAVKFNAALPTVPTNWGAAKATAVSEMLKKYGDFSDSYYALHPTINAAERAYFDWFTTGNNEYPLLALGYTDDGLLYSSNIVVNDASRLGFNSESEISGYLKDQGFELLGWDDMGLLVMYRESDKTQASAMVLTTQGQYFRDLNFQYTPDKPTTGITKTTLTQPAAKISRNGSTLTIEAGTDKGQPVKVFTLSGQVVLSTVLHEGTNTIETGTDKPVIIRVGKHQGVKAL